MGGDVFTLDGSPGDIRASALKWSGFSTAASTAAGDIRQIDSGDFLGDEADTYREKMSSDLPPHLDTTSQAWDIVAKALNGYATTLEQLQSTLKTLQNTANEQSADVNSAQGAVSDAKTADQSHTQSRQAAQQALKPGQTLPSDTYRPQTAGASAQLTAAKQALQDTIDAANTLHGEHSEAVRRCVDEINRAKGMRFVEPPGFWGRLVNSVTGWIKEHADVLRAISSVLKTISGIAGLLAMIPVLAPIMGPIALATGGAALAIDVTLKVVTGEGSWASIGLDAALMVLPGAGKLVKGAVLSTKTGQSVNKVAAAGLNAMKDSKAGQALSAVRNSKVGNTLVGGPGKALDWANTQVAKGLAHVPGASRLPGVKMNVLGRSVPGDGPVVFKVSAKATPAEAAQYERYVNSANDAALGGHLNPGGRVSTGDGKPGSLRYDSNKAARQERNRAATAGTPYKDQAGHVPDTTWINRPNPPDWHDQTSLVNQSLGGQNPQWPVGHRPTKFDLDYSQWLGGTR